MNDQFNEEFGLDCELDEDFGIMDDYQLEFDYD